MATEKPWSWFAQPQPDHDYVALVTVLPISHWTALPSFGRHTGRSIRQLARSEGLLGYSLRAAPLRRTFWTLTIWEDAVSLARYVRAQPHRDAMRWLRASGVGDFHTARWTMGGAAVPPSWEAALAHLEAA
ncbi:MAG: DUF4188 domain-containing protein [Actinobacteria bacterium]|nr:DUF4188 domain-containing protein [Actinomycetota bacterium]